MGSFQLFGCKQPQPPLSATVTSDNSTTAIAHPSRFAWMIFASINRPEPSGDNNNVEWENWMEEQEVYTDNPVPPVWHTTNQVFEKRLHVLAEQFLSVEVKDQARLMPQPINGSGGLSSSALSEVRINGPAFSDIIVNGLWTREGLKKAFAKAEEIKFSTDAKEVKAQWKVLKDTDDPSKYHCQKAIVDGKPATIGLIALAVTTKDLPNWFWATWEHVDNPNRCKEIGCFDDFGVMQGNTHSNKDGTISSALTSFLAANGLGKEWENYRLDGTQTDYIDSSGKPIKLGNSILESRIPLGTSSCMTCHSRAAINKDAAHMDFVHDGNGFIGIPHHTWYYDLNSDRRAFKTTDFVWSFITATGG
jgi:hypothetical protein